MSEKQKHTQEPWRVSDGYEIRAADDEGRFIAEVGYSAIFPEDEANAARIVQCVNACAGIEDPQEAIDRARDALFVWMDSLPEHATGRAMAQSALAALTPKQEGTET